MKQKHRFLSPTEIAARWGVHRTTAIRVMQRFGFSGVKFGKERRAPRRFREIDVISVEAAANRPGY